MATTETKIVEIKVPLGDALNQITALTAGINQLTDATKKLDKTNADEAKQIEINKLKIKDYQNQKRQLTNEVMKEVKVSNDAIGAYQKLQNEYSKAAAKAKDLAAGNTASAKEIKKAAQEADALNDKLKGIDKTVGSSVRGVGEYERGLSGLGKRFASFIGFTAIIAGLGQALRNALNVITEFDQQMANVSAITMGTKEEMKQLRDIAIQLGTSTKFSASEVAGLEVELGKLGFTSQQIIDATGGIVSAASATGESLQKTAEIVGSVTMAFGLSAGESQRVADIMAQSFNATALGLDNFSESIKYVAPVAKQVGVSVEETAALLGVLANSGIKGSMAGTALRRIFGELTKDGGTLQEKLEQLSKSGLTLSGAQDEVGAHAKTALLVLKDQNELIPKLTKEFENSAGAAEIAAAKMMDTIKGQSTILKSTWSGFILSVENGTGRFATNLKSMLFNTAEFVRGLQRLLGSDADNAKADSQAQAQSRLKTFEKNAQSQKDYMQYLNQEIVAEKNLNKNRIDDINRLKKEIASAENEGWTTYSTTRIKRLKEEAEGLTIAANKSTEYINTLGNLRRAKLDQTALEIKNQEILDKNQGLTGNGDKKIKDLTAQFDTELKLWHVKQKELEPQIEKWLETIRNAELARIKLVTDGRKSLEESLKGDTDSSDFEVEKLNKSIEQRKKNQQQFLQNQLDATIEGSNAELNAKLAILNSEQTAELAIAEQTEAQKAAIRAKYAKIELDLRVQTLQNNLSATASAFGAIQGLFKKGSKAQKAAASTQIGIDSISGAIAAFKGVVGVPIVGQVLAPLAAAGVIASGVKAIKDVWAVKEDGTQTVDASAPTLPPDLTSKMASPLTNSVQTMGATGGSNAIVSGAANISSVPTMNYDALANAMSKVPAPQLSLVELKTKQRQVDFIDNVSTLSS